MPTETEIRDTIEQALIQKFGAEPRPLRSPKGYTTLDVALPDGRGVHVAFTIMPTAALPEEG